MLDNFLTELEANIVDNFLLKFQIIQQNYEAKTIDLDLVVKGFPRVISKESIKKIKMLNFQRMHRTLINFYNFDQDEGYAYSDKSKTRPGEGISYL